MPQAIARIAFLAAIFGIVHRSTTPKSPAGRGICFAYRLMKMKEQSVKQGVFDRINQDVWIGKATDSRDASHC